MKPIKSNARLRAKVIDCLSAQARRKIRMRSSSGLDHGVPRESGLDLGARLARPRPARVALRAHARLLPRGGLFHPPTLPKISSGSIDSAISATSFKVSGPVTLHAPCMLRLLSLRLACGSSSAQVQSDRGLETRLSRLPPELPPECEPPPPQAFVGSVESTFLRRSKRPSEVPDWSHLLWQRRLASRPPGSSVWHASI